MKVDISIIIPTFNEEKNVKNIYKRFLNIFKSKLFVKYQIIFVDNASTDSTLNIIKDICKTNKCVKYITLTRNFGYQSSLLVGLDNAVGKYIMMIDSDCEDPPELLINFYRVMEQKKYNLVYGKRLSRSEFFVIKKMRDIFYHFLKFIADYNIHLYMAEFVLIDQFLKNELLMMNKNKSFHFLRADIAFIGANYYGYGYKRNPRYDGKSKFNFLGMLKFAINGILHSSTFFLKYQFVLSIIMFLFYFLSLKLMLFVLFFQLSAIAIYLSRIYRMLQGKPSYIIYDSNISS